MVVTTDVMQEGEERPTLPHAPAVEILADLEDPLALGRQYLKARRFPAVIEAVGSVLDQPTCEEGKRVERAAIIRRAEALSLQGEALVAMALGPPQRADALELIREAIQLYSEAWRLDPRRFPAYQVRCASLMARLSQLEGKGDVSPEASQLADEARHHYASLKSSALPAGACINLAEASLVQGDTDGVVSWLGRAFREGGVSPAGLAALMERYVHFWHLSEATNPGTLILPMMQAALAWQHAPVSLSPRAFDRRWLGQAAERCRFDPLRWLLRGVEAVRSVAELRHEGHQPIGSGVLVLARHLGPACPPRPALLVPSRLVSADAGVRQQFGALAPERVVAVFPHGRTFAPLSSHRVIWSSGPDRLDLTLLGLPDWPRDRHGDPLSPMSVAPRQPRSAGEALTVHEFATGGGARLVPSQLTDQGPASWVMPAAARPRLSGCPVFDRAWRLVGLHQFTDAVLGADLCLPVPWIGVSQRMEPINGQAPR